MSGKFGCFRFYVSIVSAVRITWIGRRRRERIRLRVAGQTLHVDVAPVLKAVTAGEDARSDGSVARTGSRTWIRIAAGG